MRRITLFMLLAMCATICLAQYDLRTPMTKEIHKILDQQPRTGVKEISQHDGSTNASKAAKTRKGQRKAAEVVKRLEYTSFQMNYYNGSSFSLDGALLTTYKTTVTFYDDDTVSFESLLDLAHHNNDYDTEETIWGTYDKESGIIRIETPFDNLPFVGMLYSYYSGAMVAGHINEDYSLEAEEALELQVSEDMNQIESLQNILILEIDGEQNSVHTCIKYIKMYRPQEGQKLATFCNENINYTQQLYPGTSMTKNIYFANVGSEPMDFVADIEQDDRKAFTVKPDAGTAASMALQTLTVTYNPQEKGADDATLSITSEGGEFTAPLSGECIPYPDYNAIVKEGDITLRTGVEYPFEIVKELVCVARSTTGFVVGDSWLEAEVVVPEGKIGTLSWVGVTYSDYNWGSNATIVSDGTKELFHSYMGYEDLDGQCMFTEGTHTVRFNFQVAYPNFVTEEDHMEIQSLSFTLMDIQENKAEQPEGDNLDYGNFIIGEAAKTLQAKILNIGRQPLKCVSADDAPHFHVTMNDETAETIDTLFVNIRFEAEKAGVYNETVKVNTTAGEFNVNCSALVREIPDYTKIIAKDTDTSVEIRWDYSHTDPFIIDENTNEAVNSNARVIDTKQNTSWFEASFDIPKGKRGIVSWDGMLDMDGYHPNGQYYDMAMVFISHPGRQYGVGLIGDMDCSSKGCYEACDEGINTSEYYTVGENYIRWSMNHYGDSYYSGKDEMRISNLKIVLEDFDENAAKLDKEEIDFGQMLMGKSNKATVMLTNNGGEQLKINRIECDAPVTIANVPYWTVSYLNSFELTFTFTGKEPGEHEGAITIYTSAGEYVLLFNGTVIDDTNYLLAEDFQGEMTWSRTDADGDGKGWNLLYNIYSTMSQGHCHSGDDGLGSSSYYYYLGELDPDDWAYSPMVTIPEDGEYELAWWIGVDDTDVDTYAHTYSVYVGKEMNRNTLKKSFTEKLDRTGWQERRISLKEWAGKTVCVAYRHYDSYGLGILKLDDVYIRPVSTDGISNIKADCYNDGIYNLQGVRQDNMQKGVNIVRTIDAQGNVVARKILR